MTIMEFCKEINKYKTDDKKIESLKKHITKTYAPILEKRVYLEPTILASVKEDNGVMLIDMCTNKCAFTVICFLLYTDLEVDKNSDNESMTLECYDEIKKAGLINVLFSIIGEEELTELLGVNDMLIGNWEKAHSSLEASIGNVISNFTQKLSLMKDILLDEDLTNILIGELNKEEE